MITEENYLKIAWKGLEYFKKNKKELPDKKRITSSKLRSMYSKLCDIILNKTDLEDENLNNSELADLKLLRIRIVYNMGRDEAVKLFMKETHLFAFLKYVEDNPSRKNFDLFCKYFEALVAFHRYLNPKEN